MKNTLKIITKVGADQAKGLSEKQIETLTSKGYNLWTTDDGKHDRLYLDVYNHEGMLHYGEWDGEEIFPAEQRAIKAIKVWIDAKTGEIATQSMRVNRYVTYYKQQLVDAVKVDLESIN